MSTELSWHGSWAPSTTAGPVRNTTDTAVASTTEYLGLYPDLFTHLLTLDQGYSVLSYPYSPDVVSVCAHVFAVARGHRQRPAA